MHNIKYIRNNPKQFEKLMKRRGISLNSSEIGITTVCKGDIQNGNFPA